MPLLHYADLLASQSNSFIPTQPKGHGREAKKDRFVEIWNRCVLRWRIVSKQCEHVITLAASLDRV